MAAKKKTTAPKKAPAKTTKASKKKEEANIPLETLQEKIEEIADAPPQELAPGQIQVNVDFIRTTKVHIAMPCYGGMLTESTFMSFYADQMGSQRIRRC